jgi:natural product biosynthesis luciferase-like monooxygenase protein
LEFSIFFFSADGTAVEEDRYRLLTESARFADRHGFSAVWTPERHFQVFGGLYPNPGVLSAALAMVTERVQIRAGSLVLPLQNAVRVAEDWAVVDNLSHGRAGISFATGWHHHDYVIAPGNFEDRREIMFRDIEVVRRLWAGEEVLLPAPDGKMMQVNTLPRPIQKELPFWLTVSSPRTWQKAGEIGANVLTALAGVPLDDLRGHIAVYRKARLDNGYDPRTGIVSLMLHTYVEKDLEVIRALVREPMKNYLQSYLDQFRPMTGQGLTDASSPEMQELLELAFEHYFETSSLLGTPGKCAALLEKVAAVGVNEAACLIDFGLDFETVMKGLEHLADLRLSLARETGVAENSLEFGS